MRRPCTSSSQLGSRMLQVNVARLHDDTREALALAWIAGREGGTTVRREAPQPASLIAPPTLPHPNSIQVIAAYEAGTLAAHVARLFEAHPAAVIVADGVSPPQALIEIAARTHTPLFASPLPAPRVIEVLARYLAKALAETTERHGVLMVVLGLGGLITGESGVGKSELGVELISRGHGLVADDVVEISRIAVNTLEGRCPPMLKVFLEVRGLGLLNIRTIFGETAVRRKMKLRLVAPLERQALGRDPNARPPLAAPARGPAARGAVGGHPRRARRQGHHPGRSRAQPRRARGGGGAQPDPQAAWHRLEGRIRRRPERRPSDPRRAG